MRFSDSTSYDISKPIKYANSDSSPFSSDESLSDDNSLQDNLTPPTPPNYNTDLSTKNSSLTNLNDNPPFKQKSKISPNNPPIDRSRHQSQNQSISPNPSIARTTKTHYSL